MKILFLSSALTYGGTLVRCYQLARCLHKRGHDVTVIKVSEESRLEVVLKEMKGIKVLEMPRFWGMRWFGNDRLPSDILARIVHVLTHKYDIIHLFSHHLSGYLPWRIGKVCNRAELFINDWDDLWTDGGWYGELASCRLSKFRYYLEAWLEKSARLKANGVTAISRALYDRAASLGILRERLLYMPAGADVENIYPLPTVEARKKVGLDYQGTLLLYAGFTIPQMDLITMLNALKLLINRKLEVKLLVSGLERDIIESQRQDLGIPEGAIIHLGFLSTSQFSYFLSAGDIALLPYGDTTVNRFRFPNKFGDYLAAGRPIVASAVGDIAHFIKKYQVGLLTDGTAEDFANKIAALIENLHLREQCCKVARQVAENVLSWEIHTANLESFYLKLRDAH